MREQVSRALQTITSNPRTEAWWLHTLSYLEFVGARKISRSIASTHPSADVLDHLADEARQSSTLR